MMAVRFKRRSVRLPGYDYASAGAYFVTICTHNRECAFGEIVNEAMQLNLYGVIVKNEWLKTRTMRPNIQLDEFVIMPNYIHGIIVIVHDRRGTVHRAPTECFGQPVPNSIPTIIRSFKAVVTKQINILRNAWGSPLWQRGYYEHVIRDENDVNCIREYIVNNPARWKKDNYYVQ